MSGPRARRRWLRRYWFDITAAGLAAVMGGMILAVLIAAARGQP